MPLLTTPKWSRTTLLLLSFTLSGCGPFGYIGKVSQSSVDAVERAEAAKAETYAPYEYWAAKSYLEQARVMMTYSEYERAFDYGSRAEQLAEAAERKAKKLAKERTEAQQEAASAPVPAAAPQEAQ